VPPGGRNSHIEQVGDGVAGGRDFGRLLRRLHRLCIGGRLGGGAFGVGIGLRLGIEKRTIPTTSFIPINKLRF
jgi:hypothetical protein